MIPMSENRRGGANGSSEPKRFKGKDVECGVRVMKVSNRKNGGGVKVSRAAILFLSKKPV